MGRCRHGCGGGAVIALTTRHVARSRVLVAAIFALAGCGLSTPARAPGTTPAPDPTPRTSTSAAPTTTIGLVAATTPSCPQLPERARPSADRPRYSIRASVDPGVNTVNGELSVIFTPDLDTDRLILRLWPNGPRSNNRGARLDTGIATVDGAVAASIQSDPTTLVIGEGMRFPASRPVRVAMTWSLVLPEGANDRVSRQDESVRLGSFYPILAWEPGFGWVTDPPTSGFAEASTAVVADFSLTVDAPPGFEVLASGVRDAPNHWTATAMRDVAVSVGRFTLVSARAQAPDPVEVTVGVHGGGGEAPRLAADAYLRRVVVVLENFANRFGPYPWPTFTLAITPGLGGGIEYPGHVMQGPGTLARTTSHEVGHQWFYGLVGNNQGRDPWLDEGLATWTEWRAENTLATGVQTVIPVSGRRRLAEPMTYWDAHPGDYFRSVYTQGAQSLASLGDPDLVDCALRIFVAVNAHRIARPADFVKAAHAVFPDAPARLAAYGIEP